MQEAKVREEEIEEEKEKKVVITGTVNRYQINRLKKTSCEPKLKKNTDSVPSSFYERENQLCLITELFEESELSKSSEYLYIKREIDKKLSSYKQQDQLKKRMDVDKFVTFRETLHYLKESGMQCYYCKQGLWVLYERQREMKQWTLDRKDNSIGHQTDNVVISCLECNLKRRRTNQDAFLFTKQLQLVKMDE